MHGLLAAVALQAATATGTQAAVGKQYILPPDARTACARKSPKGPWVTAKDYPREARDAGMEGTVEFTLDVSAAGCPTICTVTKSSGHLVLDRRACWLVLMRAEFKPARDEAGNPVGAKFSSEVKWDLRGFAVP